MDLFTVEEKLKKMLKALDGNIKKELLNGSTDKEIVYCVKVTRTRESDSVRCQLYRGNKPGSCPLDLSEKETRAEQWEKDKNRTAWRRVEKGLRNVTCSRKEFEEARSAGAPVLEYLCRLLDGKQGYLDDFTTRFTPGWYKAKFELETLLELINQVKEILSRKDPEVVRNTFFDNMDKLVERPNPLLSEVLRGFSSPYEEVAKQLENVRFEPSTNREFRRLLSLLRKPRSIQFQVYAPKEKQEHLVSAVAHEMARWQKPCPYKFDFAEMEKRVLAGISTVCIDGSEISAAAWLAMASDELVNPTRATIVPPIDDEKLAQAIAVLDKAPKCSEKPIYYFASNDYRRVQAWAEEHGLPDWNRAKAGFDYPPNAVVVVSFCFHGGDTYEMSEAVADAQLRGVPVEPLHRVGERLKIDKLSGAEVVSHILPFLWGKEHLR